MVEDFLPALPENEVPGKTDHMETMFDWYRHVGLLTITAMNIDVDSPACRDHPDLHFSILRGLLNRCARLVLATMKISRERNHGEIVAILARCTMETAVNGCWLIGEEDDGSFQKYLANGLKAEVKFCDLVRENIAGREGEIWEIEGRMLEFEKQVMSLAGMSEQEIVANPGLPDFYSRIRQLDYDDLAYAAIYRIGSHAVHGSWPDLVDHYLETDEHESRLDPREHNVPADVKIFVACSLHLLEFMRRYLRFAVSSCRERRVFFQRLNLVEQRIMKVFCDYAGR